MGRYKHVNDKHLTHLSRIKVIQWLTRGIPPPSPIMMRGSNHGRRLQSATFRDCVGCSSSTCNSPVCSLGCTARPRSPQKKTATASVWAYNPLPYDTVLPQYRRAGVTSQPLIKHVWSVTFGCHHWPSRQDAPSQRPSRVMSQRCLTRTSGAQELYHGICQRF
jgi:hypothetical protein